MKEAKGRRVEFLLPWTVSEVDLDWTRHGLKVRRGRDIDLVQ